MTAVDRGLMLGETPIMGSVFDLVGAKDKAQIDSAKDAIEMTKSLQTSAPSTPAPTLTGTEKEDNAPISLHGTDIHQSKFLSKFTPAESDADNAEANALNNNSGITPRFPGSLSLQPFHKDPAKQVRFDQYLSGVRQKVPDPYGEISNRTMTEWEKARERDEFSRSARLFQPMSAMMSARFVEGNMLDDKNVESKKDDHESVTDEAKAAEMKMFGKLTRDESEWHPDKLLCRRFNVPNPYPGSDIVGLPNVKRDKYSIFNFLTVGDFQAKEPPSVPESVSKDVSKQPDKDAPLELKGPGRPGKKKATLASIFKVLDDPDFHKPMTPKDSKKDISEPEKPETDEGDEESEADNDLFRAIFKNSDSEDSEEEKSERKEGDDSMSDEDDKKNEEEKMDDSNTEISSPVITTATSKPSDDVTTQSDKVFMDTEEASDGHLGILPNEERGDLVTPSKSSTDKSAIVNPFASVVRDPGIKSRRSESRWGPKSIFSVLDEINEEVNSQKAMGNEEDTSDLYGPALPPPLESRSVETPTVSEGERGVKKHQEKQRHHRHHHKEKHQKHKKEKKKKSKHKKDKKHKKNKKSSKSKKEKVESSGSDADSETSEDSVSGEELLDRFKQVSRLKSGKS